jgi:acetoacetate decarboxylase
MLKMWMCLVIILLVPVTSYSESASPEVRGFSMPLNAPEYGTPPRTYHDSKLVSITFKTSPEALRKFVPKPMVPNPDNLVSVYIGQFNTPDYTNDDFIFKGDSYLEVGFVVPVSLGKQSGGYSLFLYLNKPGPAISGREIWGFPKKEADLTMVEENGKITISVERLGAKLMKATFLRGAKVEPVPNRPARTRYNLKYIPSVKKGAAPEVMQITSYLQGTKLKELYSGKATLELSGTPVDPLGQIPIVEIVRAEYMVLDGSVDYGDVVYDYLKQYPTGSVRSGGAGPN